MKRNAWMVVPLLAACVRSAGAEPAAALDDKQLLGMRLFNQSCRVCHTKPQLTSPLYGPELSQNSAGGNRDARRHQQRHAHARLISFRAGADQAIRISENHPHPSPLRPARNENNGR
jgi:mono/diheme cytochrome c family protein